MGSLENGASGMLVHESVMVADNFGSGNVIHLLHLVTENNVMQTERKVSMYRFVTPINAEVSISF